MLINYDEPQRNAVNIAKLPLDFEGSGDFAGIFSVVSNRRSAGP
jgi:hypothetical protein